MSVKTHTTGQLVYQSSKGILVSILFWLTMLCVAGVVALFIIGFKDIREGTFTDILIMLFTLLCVSVLPLMVLRLQGRLVTRILLQPDNRIQLTTWKAIGNNEDHFYPASVLKKMELKMDNDEFGGYGLPSTPYYKLTTYDGKKYIIDQNNFTIHQPPN